MTASKPTKTTIVGRRPVAIMQALLNNGGEMSRTSLAHHSGVATGHVQHVVDGLRKLGLVAGGAYSIRLTERGAEWCEANREVRVDTVVAQALSVVPNSVFQLGGVPRRQVALVKSYVSQPTQTTTE